MVSCMTHALTSLFSIAATAAGVCLVVPQIIKTLRTRQAAGVSLGGLTASFFSWYLWIPYTLSTGDLRTTIGLAIPGAIQGFAVLVAYRYRAERTGLLAPVMLVTMVAGAYLLGGWKLYLIALGTTTIWAYVPSILSAACSADISGISSGAWWVTVVYGVCWGMFGLLSGLGGFIYTGSMNAGLSLVMLGVLYVRKSRSASSTRTPLEGMTNRAVSITAPVPKDPVAV